MFPILAIMVLAYCAGAYAIQRFWLLVIYLSLPLLGLWLLMHSANAMGSTKFGTYSQAYLDRQKCKITAADSTSVARCNRKSPSADRKSVV